MDYPGFIGPSYMSQSPLSDCERLMNFYVEPIETPYGRNRAALYPTPGFTPFVGMDQGIVDIGTRAGFDMNGRCFAVVGTGLYEIFINKTITKRGTVALGSGDQATISSNGAAGNQLLITAGGNAYVYDLATNTLSEIGALHGLATMGGMVDGYGLVFNANNSTVYVSNLNDFSAFTPGLNFFQRSIAPDPWKAMVIRRSEVILVGEYTGEVWRDVNASVGQPFAPDLGAVFTAGTSAQWSVKVSDDLVVWLQQTPAGGQTIVSMPGYVPQKISNYGVDTAVAGYQRTQQITDAETLIYADQGHTFAIVRFPKANATWAVDTANNYWHERGFWNSGKNQYDIWRPRVHWTAFGKHLVGDAETGTISEQDVSVGTEADGSNIRRLRIGPALYADANRFWVDYFELGVQPGLGLQQGQGSDPQAMLRVSKNYGQTWGNQRMRSAGAAGKYGQRVFWTRNGSSRGSWVPEVSVSDPIPWRLTYAVVEGRGIANRQAA